MIYSSILQISDEAYRFIDTIDLEHYKFSLFGDIASKMKENLSGVVEEVGRLDHWNRKENLELRLDLVIYSKDEFKSKMERLENSIVSLHPEEQQRVMSIFKKDSMEEHKSSQPVSKYSPINITKIEDQPNTVSKVYI